MSGHPFCARHRAKGLCWTPDPSFSTLCHELGAALQGLGQWAPFRLAPGQLRMMGSPGQRQGKGGQRG